jgi:hypothetical protein
MSVNLSPACSDTMTHSKAMVIELLTLMTRLVSIACTTTSTVTLIGKLAHRAGTRLRTALGKCRVSRAFQPAAGVCWRPPPATIIALVECLGVHRVFMDTSHVDS